MLFSSLSNYPTSLQSENPVVELTTSTELQIYQRKLIFLCVYPSKFVPNTGYIVDVSRLIENLRISSLVIKIV